MVQRCECLPTHRDVSHELHVLFMRVNHRFDHPLTRFIGRFLPHAQRLALSSHRSRRDFALKAQSVEEIYISIRPCRSRRCVGQRRFLVVRRVLHHSRSHRKIH